MNIQSIDDMIMNGITNTVDIKIVKSINVIISPTNIIIVKVDNDAQCTTRMSIIIEIIINIVINITIDTDIKSVITDIISTNASMTDITNNINTPYRK